MGDFRIFQKLPMLLLVDKRGNNYGTRYIYNR